MSLRWGLKHSRCLLLWFYSYLHCECCDLLQLLLIWFQNLKEVNMKINIISFSWNGYLRVFFPTVSMWKKKKINFHPSCPKYSNIGTWSEVLVLCVTIRYFSFGKLTQRYMCFILFCQCTETVLWFWKYFVSLFVDDVIAWVLL